MPLNWVSSATEQILDRKYLKVSILCLQKGFTKLKCYKTTFYFFISIKNKFTAYKKVNKLKIKLMQQFLSETFFKYLFLNGVQKTNRNVGSRKLGFYYQLDLEISCYLPQYYFISNFWHRMRLYEGRWDLIMLLK